MLHDSLEKKLQQLYSFTSEEKELAQAFLEGLSPLEGRYITLSTDATRIQWLKPYPDALVLPFPDENTGIMTVDQAGALYASLKSLVVSAHKKAEEENKPLHIIVGEAHMDRCSLLVNLMLMHIAKDLEIKQMGVELFPEGTVKTEDGIEVQGFDKVQADIKKRRQLPPEHDGNSTMKNGSANNRLRKNCQFQMFLAKETNMSCFANDPNGYNEYTPTATDDDTFINRERPMMEKMQELADEGISAISIYGASHLEGIKNRLPENAHTLMIDVMNSSELFQRKSHQPFIQKARAEAIVLPDSPQEAAVLAHEDKVVFVKTPGDRIQTAQQAWDLAHAVFRRQSMAALAERPKETMGRSL